MKKIEAIIRPSDVDSLLDALENIGITGVNIFNVKGYGTQKGHEQVYRGVIYHVRLREKARVELVVTDNMVEEVIDTIITTTRTGKIGDGKIFISPIEEVIRIRTGERDQEAL